MTQLQRKLSFTDAVVIGLGAMIGAGIFSAVGPAARAAGEGIFLSLAIAALVAALNALTMAQLAAVYPEVGGAYVYGRKLLGDYWGFLAGWGFVVGKTASCAAMALTLAYYVAPGLSRLVAPLVVLLLTAINFFGIKKTAGATRVIVALVIATLAIAVVTAWVGGLAQSDRLAGAWTTGVSLRGVFEGGGIFFFAFAGYARIATVGGEVHEPERTIPRALLTALALVLALYFVVIISVVASLDLAAIAESRAPLALVVERGAHSALAPLVRAGAMIASAGVLLSLLAGVSRTIFAMAKEGDLPKVLGRIHEKRHSPYVAELIIGGIVALVCAFADLRESIGFSSFAVLTYYAVANAAALRLAREKRRSPKVLSWLGFAGCAGLALSLPFVSVAGGFALLVVGSVAFFVRHLLKA